jgi:hypothetical protein
MNSLPSPNVLLLTRTLRHIEENPAEWRQDTWICGTTACFAGRACLIAQQDGMAEVVVEGDAAPFVVLPDETTSVEEAARKLLGLTRVEADNLFHGYASLHWMQDYVDRIIRGKTR